MSPADQIRSLSDRGTQESMPANCSVMSLLIERWRCGIQPAEKRQCLRGARVGGTSSGGMEVFCSFLRWHDQQIHQQSARVALSGLSPALLSPGNGWRCLLPPAHPVGEVTMRAGKATLANFGTSMGNAGFNALDFSPDHPDEMGLWPKGDATPG